jgi:hypothetical protein
VNNGLVNFEQLIFSSLLLSAPPMILFSLDSKGTMTEQEAKKRAETSFRKKVKSATMRSQYALTGVWRSDNEVIDQVIQHLIREMPKHFGKAVDPKEFGPHNPFWLVRFSNSVPEGTNTDMIDIRILDDGTTEFYLTVCCDGEKASVPF